MTTPHVYSMVLNKMLLLYKTFHNNVAFPKIPIPAYNRDHYHCRSHVALHLDRIHICSHVALVRYPTNLVKSDLLNKPIIAPHQSFPAILVTDGG